MIRRPSPRTTRILVPLVAIGLAVACVASLRVSTDVTRFLPDAEDAEVAALSRRLAASDLTRTMVLSLRARDPAHTLPAAADLAERLAGLPEVEEVRAGVDPDQLRELYALYFPRRLHFLSDRPETLAETHFSDAALATRAATLRRNLAQPSSTLLKRVAPEDPIGAFGAILERIQGTEAALRVVDGQFVSRDGEWAILFLRTHASGFDSAVQTRVLAAVAAARAEVERAFGPLVLEQSGVNRFAVSAEQSIRADIALIAACSFFGVAAVFLLFFRSLHAFALCMVPPVLGFLVATSAGLLVRGDLDGLTLGFGVTLIGVAIDYSIHLASHHRLAGPGADPRALARGLRSPVGLGALTTMASFAGLALTSFPGLRELGLFAMTGVGVAALVTLYVLPDLLPVGRATPATASGLAERLEACVAVLERHRRWLWVVPAVLLLLAPLLWPRLHWIDDLSRLANLDPALRQEEARVRGRVSRMDSGRFVIAMAETEAEAIALNDVVHARLVEARDAGAFGAMRSLHAVLWSPDLQVRNAAAARAEPGLAARLDRVYGEAGFRPGAFAPFEQFLKEAPAPPLTPDALRGTGLETLMRTLLLDLGDRTAVVTYLRDVADLKRVEAKLADLPGAWVFDQDAFADSMYRAFREATLRQIGVGTLLVALVLLLRYRALRPAFAAFFPSLLVAAGLLEAFALTGAELNLLHVVCLIMVMGMGVDYGIFLVDGAQAGRRLGPTLVSLLLSCLTTVFVFGTLAISSHPALRAIGATTGGGILLSFLLAPLTYAIVGRPKDAGASG